jgi:hypothetical protein
MENDKLKEMQRDAIDVIENFNAKLKEFTKKYPGFVVAICDAVDVYDGSKEYRGEILGKI